jgi:hypothetical protein
MIDPFEYMTSKVFTLTETNLISETLVCYKNGAIWEEEVTGEDNFTYSTGTGRILVTADLTPGDILEFVYDYYSKYSENEIIGYIKSAVIYLSLEKYGTFIFGTGDVIDPEPTEEEENLIALISCILIKRNVISYKTPELTVVYKETMSVEEKIKMVINQYKKAYGEIDYIDLTNYNFDYPEEEEI